MASPEHHINLFWLSYNRFYKWMFGTFFQRQATDYYAMHTGQSIFIDLGCTFISITLQLVPRLQHSLGTMLPYRANTTRPAINQLRPQCCKPRHVGNIFVSVHTHSLCYAFGKRPSQLKNSISARLYTWYQRVQLSRPLQPKTFDTM